MADVILRLAERIDKMPRTNETCGQGENTIVYLHYFAGTVDAWITEKDVQLPGESGDQIQAFGKITLFGDNPEWGYISIAELIENGVELDLYWEPVKVNEKIPE